MEASTPQSRTAAAQSLPQEVDVRQDLTDQYQVMRLDPPDERLAQPRQLGPLRLRAKSANTSGSRSPASMARPLVPRISLATAASLMLAPSSAFYRRFAWSALAWT